MSETSTTILAVVDESGDTVHVRASNAILFEVAEGSHQGTRGADWQLYDLVGRVRWDRSRVVNYVTGKIQTGKE